MKVRLSGAMRRTLPVVQQNELAECGLACLAMIANYHGHEVDLAALRRRFAVSLKGTSLARLIQIADSLTLDARPFRTAVEELGEIREPCILHWDLNHFVVLKGVNRGKFEIHDPAQGALRMSAEELGKHFTGVVLELSPAQNFTPVKARQAASIGALVGQVTGIRRAAAQVLILAVVLEFFTLMLPLAMQWTLDSVLVAEDWGLLHLIGIGFSFMVLMQAAISVMRGWIVAEVGASLSAQWATNLFGHLMQLPIEFFEKRSVGGVLSRFLSVQAIQQTLTGSFIVGVLDGVTVALVLVLLLLYSAKLTALVLLFFAAYALSRWLFFSHLQELKEGQLAHIARQQSHMIESIEGIQTIKLANRQAERRARMANVTIDIANREIGINRVAANFSSLSKLIFGLQRILLIWICASLVLRQDFTAGMLVVFVAYSDLFVTRGASLIDKLVELRLLRMHAGRIADVALEEPEQHLHVAHSGVSPRPRIQVEGVSFRYGEDEPWVLRNCTFSIEAGECVAIIGPSGCGKTTLAKLILGLLHPQEGRISIDGIDIRRYGLAQYRSRIGAVLQDDTLFAGSIADNISSFDPDATLEDIQEAARSAHIHDDIVAMTMGYESLVGDMGSTLSGGQKQRIVLARALYRKPDVLLLDEATSHLDVLGERNINENVSALAVTRIVIAHRPETIRSADRRILLTGGRAACGDSPKVADGESVTSVLC